MQKIEFRAAQLRFNRLLDRAQRGEQFEITVRGKSIARLGPPDRRREQTKGKGNLARFFARSPLRGSGIRISRISDGRRKIDL